MTEGLDLLSTADLMAMEPPSWLVEEFVAENSTTMIYGPWGLGKSFLALDMVLTATTGETWLGGRKIAKPLKTLYGVAEGVAWWPRRIEAYEMARGPVDHENVLWYPKPVNLYKPKGRSDGVHDIDRLRRSIEDHEPDILVIDTWVRCTGGFGMNENDSTSVAEVYRELDSIRDEFGVSPVLIHHPTKQGNSARGSGNQMASVERVISLEAMNRKEQFKVVDEKGNHMEPFDPFVCRFESVSLASQPGETSAIVLHDGMAPDVTAGQKPSSQQNEYARRYPEFVGVPDKEVAAELGCTPQAVGNWRRKME